MQQAWRWLFDNLTDLGTLAALASIAVALFVWWDSRRYTRNLFLKANDPLITVDPLLNKDSEAESARQETHNVLNVRVRNQNASVSVLRLRIHAEIVLYRHTGVAPNSHNLTLSTALGRDLLPLERRIVCLGAFDPDITRLFPEVLSEWTGSGEVPRRYSAVAGPFALKMTLWTEYSPGMKSASTVTSSPRHFILWAHNDPPYVRWIVQSLGD